MNRKICILIIFMMLVSTHYSLASETNSTEKKPTKKVEFISRFKKDNKTEVKKTSEEVQVNNTDTVFTIKKEEQPSEKKEVKTKKEDKSKLFDIFKKKDKKSQTVKETSTDKAHGVTSSPEESTSKKIERVTDTNTLDVILKTNSGNEIKILDDSLKNAAVFQGSVASDKIISVDDCVKLALENHPAIRSSRSSADIYKNKIAQAWAAYFPTFTLDANYTRNDMLVTNFAFPTQKYGLYNTPRIGADMLLFDFGKTKAAADISKKTYEAAQSNLQMSINDVIFNVKKAYYNLLFAIQQEKVYSDTVKDYELHLKQAQAYYTIGTKAKIDVMTAEYNLGKAKLNQIKAKNTIAIAYAQVNNAMGIPEFENYNISDKLDSWSYDVKFEDIIKTAYETRPELLAAKKKAEGSELLIRASVRAFTPDIKAFGNYTLGGKTPANDHGYQLGAGLSYRSTNLYLLKKQVDESKANYQKDLADFENVRQSVYLDVKQAYIDLYNAQDSIPVARLSMKRAKEQYNLASGRYKVGLGDAIELKDAENTYRTAQLDYYSALLNYNVAAANIERVIGSPIKHTDNSLL